MQNVISSPVFVSIRHSHVTEVFSCEFYDSLARKISFHHRFPKD